MVKLVYLLARRADVPADKFYDSYTKLVEDERRFVEMSRSRCFLTKEHVIFDYTRQIQSRDARGAR